MDTVAKFEEPFTLFGQWFEKATAKEIDVPEAMAVASATPEGKPSVRMVLLKDWDQKGFVFYTNFDSQKGQELQKNAAVALLFHWKSLKRQVRIEGHVEGVSAAEADAYFQGRPRDSRIGAWASKQSRAMTERLEFEKEIARYVAKFGIGEIPRPENWSGFRIIPKRFEFWEDRPFRLHDRQIYILDPAHKHWKREILFP